MKNKNGIYIIGVDHGYGNIKTANYCFPTGVESSDTEPTFKNDLLIYQGRYYQIGVGHKEYVAEKVMDEDYYILTLAAIARELSREQITHANVFLAAGLPLSWVAKQRKAFQTYLLQKSTVEFTFRRKDYHIRIVGAVVYPQGFAAKHWFYPTIITQGQMPTTDLVYTFSCTVSFRAGLFITELWAMWGRFNMIEKVMSLVWQASPFVPKGSLSGHIPETLCT